VSGFECAVVSRIPAALVFANSSFYRVGAVVGKEWDDDAVELIQK